MKFHRRLLISAVILLSSSLSSHAEAIEEVGIRTMTATAAHRGGSIELTVWYPAGAGGFAELVGESPVFAGVAGWRDAPIADGIFPVVLVAHGGLRANPASAGWIAAHLAARGNIVVVALPPKLSPSDAHVAPREIWLRPADLSAALSAAAVDPALAPHVDLDKVAALGFFLGGTSSLAIAGARLDAESYQRSCDAPNNGPDCRWLAKSGVDLHALNAESITASHLDPRIKMAIAVNAELDRSFSADSLAAIEMPVQIIDLGQATNTGLEKTIPAARYMAIADASPFSVFAICQPKAAIILAEEGEDDAVCHDGGQRSRGEIHVEIGGIIEAALLQGFSAQP